MTCKCTDSNNESPENPTDHTIDDHGPLCDFTTGDVGFRYEQVGNHFVMQITMPVGKGGSVEVRHPSIERELSESAGYAKENCRLDWVEDRQPMRIRVCGTRVNDG